MAVFVGIDPGVQTGFAAWDGKARKFVEVDTLNIVQALSRVLHYRGDEGTSPVVYMEDARQRKWIPREQSLSQFKGRAMGAGSVKRDCQIWEDFCFQHGIEFHAVPPRKGATKWEPDYFKKVTGWTGRTSNHARDAALLVFGK